MLFIIIITSLFVAVRSVVVAVVTVVIAIVIAVVVVAVVAVVVAAARVALLLQNRRSLVCGKLIIQVPNVNIVVESSLECYDDIIAVDVGNSFVLPAVHTRVLV